MMYHFIRPIPTKEKTRQFSRGFNRYSLNPFHCKQKTLTQLEETFSHRMLTKIIEAIKKLMYCKADSRDQLNLSVFHSETREMIEGAMLLI